MLVYIILLCDCDCLPTIVLDATLLWFDVCDAFSPTLPLVVKMRKWPGNLTALKETLGIWPKIIEMSEKNISGETVVSCMFGAMPLFSSIMHACLLYLNMMWVTATWVRNVGEFHNVWRVVMLTVCFMLESGDCRWLVGWLIDLLT